MTREEVIKRINNLAYDVNPSEIASHIQDDSLREWCYRWLNKMIEEASLIYLIDDREEGADNE